MYVYRGNNLSYLLREENKMSNQTIRDKLEGDWYEIKPGHPDHEIMSEFEDGDKNFYQFFDKYRDKDKIYIMATLDDKVQEFTYEIYNSDDKVWHKEERYIDGIKRFTAYRLMDDVTDEDNYYVFWRPDFPEVPSLTWYNDDGTMKSMEYRQFNRHCNDDGPSIITDQGEMQFFYKGDLLPLDEYCQKLIESGNSAKAMKIKIKYT